MSKLTFTYELVNGDGKALHTEAVAGDGIQEIMERLVKALAKYSDTTINITELHMNGKVIQDAKRLQTVTAMTTLVAEHVALSLAQSKGKRSLAENLRTILSNPKKRAKLIAELNVKPIHRYITCPECNRDNINLSKPIYMKGKKRVCKSCSKKVNELELPSLEKGDILLVGKFKNRRAEITDFETDDKGQPVAKTTKGDQKIFKPRIAKLMPDTEPEEKKADVNEEEELYHLHAPGQKDHGKQKVLHTKDAAQMNKGAEGFKWVKHNDWLKTQLKKKADVNEEEELYHLHAPGQKDHGKQKVLHTKDAAQMNKGAEGFKWVKHNDWLKTQLKKEAEIIDKMGKKTKQTKGQLVPRPISAGRLGSI